MDRGKLYRHSTSYYRKCKKKTEAQKAEMRKSTLEEEPSQYSINILASDAYSSASTTSSHEIACSSQLIESNVQIRNDHIQKNNNEESENEDFEIKEFGNDDSGNDDFNRKDIITSLKLTQDLKEWTVQHKPTTASLNDLLGIMNKYGFKLPKDGRSLLKTDDVVIKAMGKGQFWYQGVRNNLEKNISSCDLSSVTNIELLINVDGMSLFNSTASEVWPISFAIFGMPNVKTMFAAIYYGNGKPPLDLFLREFIDEMNYLVQEGITIKEKRLRVKIRCFVCDTPARAYLKGTPGFNATKSSCIKCTVEGIWDKKGRHMRYPMFECPLRTDASFRSKMDEDHHQEESPLVELPIDMVKDFIVADSLHLLHLGHRKRYDASLSSTSKTPPHFGWLIGNFFGWYTTIPTHDYIMFLGMNMSRHTVMGVTDWPSFYTDATIDGELGLWPTSSIFTTIMDYKLFNRNVFSIYANKDDTAELIFGDSDPNHYSGNMTYFDVKGRIVGEWNFGFDSLSDGKDVIYQNCKVFIWIGYDHIMTKKQLINKWMSVINATVHEKQHKVPCDRVEDLPPFVISGQGQNYSIPAKDYVNQDKDASGLCSLRFKDYGDTWLDVCTVSLGNLWLKNYYLEFDFGNMRVGIATVK